jgi:hypothetical protein
MFFERIRQANSTSLMQLELYTRVMKHLTQLIKAELMLNIPVYYVI